ncbi:hypothetical protein [Neisseria wadsworthii]|uniref:hypothetical protein n=1 Tax=Neisseria wadsworthii TaxID=607711 RepID=UPI001F2258B3|nr:hypothetical protein [Neisseria wadsworthii]
MKTFFKHSALMLGLTVAWAAQVQAGPIYECNGVYTDKPSPECRSRGKADLPAIGNYTSAAPKLVYSAPTAPVANQLSAQQVKRTVAKAQLPVRQPNIQQAAYKAPQAMNTPAVVSTSPKPGGNSGRRSILEQELHNERKALAQAQADLIRARAVKNGTINQQQISSLQSHVLDRQQNIQALQRELGRM